jgi:hypothetical protein
MENNYIEYIHLGIRVSGLLLILLLLPAAGRLFYRFLIRPWRKYPRLSLNDLKRSRRRTLMEGPLAKLLRTCILLVGGLFIILMAVNLFIAATFQAWFIPTRDIRKNAVHYITSGEIHGDAEKLLENLVCRKDEALVEIRQEIARMENEHPGGSQQLRTSSADYRALCLIRDLLEGHITTEELSEKREEVNASTQAAREPSVSEPPTEKKTKKKKKKKKRKKAEQD